MSPRASARTKQRVLRGCCGLAWMLGCMLSSSAVKAQRISVCEVLGVDHLRVATVLAVELQKTVSIEIGEPCPIDQVEVTAFSSASEATPPKIALSLSAVEPAARARFLALVIAEMVRNAVRSTSAPATQDAPLPPSGAGRALRLAEPTATSLGQVFATSSDRWVPSERADPQSSSSVRLHLGAGARVFLGSPLTPIAGITAALTWRRLSVHLESHVARTSEPFGDLTALQATLGGGLLLFKWEGDPMTMTWRLRGEIGIGLGIGDANSPGAVGHTDGSLVSAGMFDVSFLFDLGSRLTLGPTVTGGLQQGFRVMETSPDVTALALHGFFVGTHLQFGIAL